MSDWLQNVSNDTECLEPYTWRVNSLNGLLAEIASIKEVEEAPLWRGHADSTWTLDSTMARWVQANLRNKTFSSLIERVSPQSSFGDFSRFALFKFKHALKPAVAFEDVCRKNNLDPHFEVIKNLQQFPEIYSDWMVQTGTPMLDWSEDPFLASYFTISNANGDSLISGQGAIFAFLKSRSGNTWIKTSVDELFDAWEAAIDKQEKPGMPLIIHPESQMDEERPRAQKAVYVLQADLANPLDIYWHKKSEEIGKQIFLKVLVPSHVKIDLWEYLKGQHITNESLFPPIKVT